MSIDQRVLDSLGSTATVRDARRYGGGADILLVIDAAPDGDTNRYLMSGAGVAALQYQSAMNLARRDRLLLHYDQMMALAFLICGDPRSALLLGLGGGAVWRYVRRAYPACAITAVERSTAVIELARRWFAVDGPIVQADAAGYMAATNDTWDVILVDLYDARGFCDQPMHFWRRCAASLSVSGVLAINWAAFAGAEANRRRAEILSAFLPHCLYVAARDRRDNVIQFCSRRPLPSAAEIAAGLPAPASMQNRRISLSRCLVGETWPA